jgi:hypothetical protein
MIIITIGTVGVLVISCKDEVDHFQFIGVFIIEDGRRSEVAMNDPLVVNEIEGITEHGGDGEEGL